MTEPSMLEIAKTKLEWNRTHDDKAVLTDGQERVLLTRLEELEKHMKALVASEPDKKLAGHIENTMEWDEWNYAKNAAIKWARWNLKP